MKKRIVVGIPTYNEAKTVQEVTEKIDEGLRNYFKPEDCVILNVDSESTDKTRLIFERTKTCVLKKSVNVEERPRGKGRNLITIFKIANNLSADYVLSVDADVKTLTSEWVLKLLSPLTTQNYDFCLPLYKRSRFEGNITNHFTYPLVYGFFGANIRQPIGGDFAFSRRFYKYLTKQPTNNAVLQYGIDIFITCNSIAGGFKSTEAYLGEKIHNPSFYHMVPTFQNVFESGIFTTRDILLNSRWLKFGEHNFQKGNRSGISDARLFRHKEFIPEVKSKCSKEFIKGEEKYKFYLGKYYGECNNIITGGKLSLSADLWTDVLVKFISHCYRDEFDIRNLPLISELVTPIYLWRAMSYWREVEHTNSIDAEQKIVYQANIFREKLAPFILRSR